MRHVLTSGLCGLALLAASAVAGPVPGQPEPLMTAPGSFSVTGTAPSYRLEIVDGQGRRMARYDLAGCRFCDGPDPDCARDGVFALLMHGLREPMVAAVCHPEGGGQQLSVFAPGRDRKAPVLTLRGARFLRLSLGPEGLEAIYDEGGRTRSEAWNPADDANVDEIAWVGELIEGTRGRRIGDDPPIADPDLEALAARLRTIAANRDAEALVALASPDILVSFGGSGGVEELRGEIEWPGFWDEFEAVLAGGAAFFPDFEGGRMAAFPALFRTWPEDLDPFDYALASRRGATLRAGPSLAAPALAAIAGQVISRGAYLEADGSLYDAGWTHVCAAGFGCGFLPMAEVESPIGRRAVFVQDRPGGPWVLDSYVAGD